MTLYRRQGKRPSPRKRKAKRQNACPRGILQIAEKRRKAKGKGEKERYTHLNAELQRTRRDKQPASGAAQASPPLMLKSVFSNRNPGFKPHLCCNMSQNFLPFSFLFFFFRLFVFPSFLKLNYSLLYVCTTFCVSIRLLMGTWVASTFGVLRMMLHEHGCTDISI